MRSEKHILDLILNTAKQDKRIRGVILNGSRANPKAKRDIFQDFDIIYLVKGFKSFLDEPRWIERFGELMILQKPDDMQSPAPQAHVGYTYLMQFKDGNRIDLTLFPLDQLDALEKDSLSVVLLDKDGSLAALPPASEADYLPKPPSAKQFDDCCNEFWWVCPYVAKGLWRKEILYARYMLDQVVREQLMQMLTWYIGIKTGFSANPGKLGKHFEAYLEPELWQQLLGTFTEADYHKTWDALFSMGALFRQVAIAVAGTMGFVYPAEDDENVTKHLGVVRGLPADAQDIYPDLMD